MIEAAIRRAQGYFFLSHAFLYPQENWLEDIMAMRGIFRDLDTPFSDDWGPLSSAFDLSALQYQHRLVFGLAGSLCYETELGLPHEFRQSQELADIAGFYRAFGFENGALVRERPDHLATELEFMYLLTLKEAYARQNGLPTQAEICQDAAAKFLQDHLARWIGPFCRSLERSTDERLGEDGLASPYLLLARLTEAFLTSETARLGVIPQVEPQAELQLTPFDPDPSCAGCAVAELNP